MSAPEIPAEAQSALQNVVDSGHAEWYLSGGEKVEFTAIGFCTWYMAERLRIREQVATEIEETVCAPPEGHTKPCPDCYRYKQMQKDARVARGES